MGKEEEWPNELYCNDACSAHRMPHRVASRPGSSLPGRRCRPPSACAKKGF